MSEAKKRSDVLKDVRSREFPGPKTCQEALKGISDIQQHMQGSQDLIESGKSPDVAPRYLAAYTTVLAEYTDYYTNNCSVSSPASPANTPVASSGDPVLDSAHVPAGNVSPGTGSGGSTTQPANPPTPPGENDQWIKPIPNWAVITGGALLLGTIIFVIAKKSSS